MIVTMDQTAWILVAIALILLAAAIIWAWIDEGPTHGVWILVVIAFVVGTVFILRTVNLSDVKTVVQNITATETPTTVVDQRILDAQATSTALAYEQSVAATLTALVPAPTNKPEPTARPTEETVDIDATTDGQFPQCQSIQSAKNAADVISGAESNWTVPDWVSNDSQGAFKFRSKGKTHLEYPGFGYFDTPSGRYIQADVTADDASFHCEEPPTS